MHAAIRIASILSWVVVAATAVTAQSNGMPLNNHSDTVFFYSDPSVGGITGDLFWKVLAGDRVMTHSTPAGVTMGLDGFAESIFDTDWSTPASFYDRSIGPALPSTTTPGNLEPAFFQLGFTTEVIVSLGSSGFGSPCTLFPSLCSPTTSTCAPPGFVLGWGVGIGLTSAVVLPADGTSSSDMATTYFVPGGMTATGGACGMGDYSLQDSHSLNETQADDLGGINAYGGFQLAGGGPIAELPSETLANYVTFAEPILNVQAATFAGLVETDGGVGGAMNGLKLSVGSGVATIGVEVRANQYAGQFAQAAASLTPIAPPGMPVSGAFLLIAPDALFTFTSAAWVGTVPFSSVQLAVPASAVGTDVYLQGAAIDTAAGQANNTNRVRTSLLP